MQRLRDVRRGQLLSMRALAEKAGVSVDTIRKTEGRLSTPSFRTIRRLSEALGKKPEAIAEFYHTIRDEG